MSHSGSSIPGESPPPPPRAHFGRGELIEKIVGLAEHLTPLALIGVGGIGKTSTALTALHNDRIKQRFGDNRRFIRCDQFHASLTHFLRRLSAAIGAGVENPEDLILLRPFLSSKDMLIILDNAESILDPQGTDAQEIYAAVEELSQFDNICLCVTSRISTIPPACESLDIPTLSMEAARDTFYRIYKHGGRSDKVNDILKRLDFHPLSITLLATVSHHNKWDMVRLTREWERRRTNVLQTQYNNSLAATIELSLASPMFQELGPDARDLLGVVAFFPQGVDEDNLDWLFPTIPDRTNIFDNFCILSLTYRSNGFITMLAPLRDYLRPEDPASSPLLRATKEHYITRLSVDLDPNRPGFGEARWIVSEDENVEHLLDVFTSIDANSTDVWDACANFMRHLYWHKPRLSALGPKIERLPDDHPSKPQCLVLLSWTFESVKNRAEYKRLLSHALKLQRQRGDDLQVARTLRYLSDANRLLGLYKEGVRQANEALEIHERHDDTVEQADCLNDLAWLLYGDKQFDASEEAASRAIALLPEKDGRFMVCQCHRILGKIYRSKGEREKAISHFEVALGIASSSNWHDELVGVHCSLAKLFAGEGGFDEAHAHVKKAKSHAVNNPYSPGVAIAANNPYSLGVAMELQARIWYKQCRFEEAKSEVLRAAEVYEKLGATKDVEDCGKLLRDVQRELDDPAASGKTDFNCELPETVPLPARANLLFQAEGTQ